MAAFGHAVMTVLVMVMLKTASAQLATTGMCETQTIGGSCEPSSQDCSPGKRPLKNNPWLCGGWMNVCCVPDSSDRTTTTTTTTTILDDSECGLGAPTSRILSGLNTSLCDWPFVVSIRGRVQTSVPLTQETTQHVCGGVIIDRNWVLTHAICLYATNKLMSEAANEFVVVAGEYDTSKMDLDPRYPFSQPLEQFVGVAQAFVHPGFTSIRTLSDINLADNREANGNALALLKLAQPVNNFCASVACLPSASPMTSSSCDTFDQCVILGWGFDQQNLQSTGETLMQGFVKIYKDQVCDFLQEKVFTSGPARFNGSACMSSDLEQYACLGDQGGPVLCYDGMRWAVQGVAPFTICSDDKPHNPYVVDVTPFQDWIYDTIKRYTSE